MSVCPVKWKLQYCSYYFRLSTLMYFGFTGVVSFSVTVCLFREQADCSIVFCFFDCALTYFKFSFFVFHVYWSIVCSVVFASARRHYRRC